MASDARDAPDRRPRPVFVQRSGDLAHGVRRAETFADVAAGEIVRFKNSCGLVEAAMNKGDAAGTMGLRVGAPVLAIAPD